MIEKTLTGRSALVTGSTSGLGAGIAAALAAAGAHVVVTGRTRASGEQVVTQIESSGGRATFIPVDFAVGPSAITDLASAALEAVGGRLDVLVNNVATLIRPAPTAEVSAEEISAGRMSTVAEVAAAGVFLSGTAAASIHGALLSMDGGWAAT